MLSVIMLSVAISYCYAERHNAECNYSNCCYAKCYYSNCCYAECYFIILIVVMLSIIILIVVLLSVIKLSVIMLSVIMLSVIMLCVVAPDWQLPSTDIKQIDSVYLVQFERLRVVYISVFLAKPQTHD